MSIKRRIGEFLYTMAERLSSREKVDFTIQNVLDRILDRKIEWVNWQKLGREDRLAWSAEAKSLLDNRAFRSLCGYKKPDGSKKNGELVKSIIESGFRYSQDFQTLRDARMIICGIEKIREEAENMLYDEATESKDNLNDVI